MEIFRCAKGGRKGKMNRRFPTEFGPGGGGLSLKGGAEGVLCLHWVLLGIREKQKPGRKKVEKNQQPSEKAKKEKEKKPEIKT